MSVRVLQLTLREWRDHFSEGLTWALTGVVGFVLGLAGPFGTYNDFSPAESVAYWLAVAYSTYAIGLFFVVLVINFGQQRGWPVAVSALLGGLIAGPPVTLVVLAINLLAYGLDHEGTMSAWRLLGYCTAIALGVSAAFTLIRLKKERVGVQGGVNPAAEGTPAPIPPTTPEGPRILERLPLKQRGQLLALSVQDHYTQVVTDKAKPLVLIRLSDAISETAGVEGLQIHRSHWVALAAVRQARIRSGRMEVELENGDVLPVSRTYAAEVRKAGLVV